MLSGGLARAPGPVRFSAGARRAELNPFAGRDLSDLAERRARCGENSELKIFSQRFLIEVQRHLTARNQSGDLGGESDFVSVPCVKQWTLTSAIADQRQALMS